MITSTPEFLEVLHTVNQMLGRVDDRSALESLQHSAMFDIIPLPHSQDKFICIFTVPAELLGESGCRRSQQLEFGEYPEFDLKPRIVHKPPQILCSFDVRTLFDVNLALYRFEAILAPAIPSAQWTSVKRSTNIFIAPRAAADKPLTMVVAVEANPAGQLVAR